MSSEYRRLQKPIEIMSLKPYKNSVTQSWRTFWAAPGRRIELFFSFIILTSVMLSKLRFLQFNETRAGRVLRDPLLNIFTPLDLSGLIFFLIYLGIICAIIVLLPHPGRILIGMQVYTVYAALRMLAMFIVPLEPPEGIIPLTDPLMSWASTGVQMNKDLFFSGHTATMFILYLMLPPGRWRWVFLTGVFVMATSLIIQRVHYSIDVIAAPFFCFGAHAFVLRMRKIAGLGMHF